MRSCPLAMRIVVYRSGSVSKGEYRMDRRRRNQEIFSKIVVYFRRRSNFPHMGHTIQIDCNVVEIFLFHRDGNLLPNVCPKNK